MLCKSPVQRSSLLYASVVTPGLQRNLSCRIGVSRVERGPEVAILAQTREFHCFEASCSVRGVEGWQVFES